MYPALLKLLLADERGEGWIRNKRKEGTYLPPYPLHSVTFIPTTNH
jgi:hypothetical protein